MSTPEKLQHTGCEGDTKRKCETEHMALGRTPTGEENPSLECTAGQAWYHCSQLAPYAAHGYDREDRTPGFVAKGKEINIRRMRVSPVQGGRHDRSNVSCMHGCSDVVPISINHTSLCLARAVNEILRVVANAVLTVL